MSPIDSLLFKTHQAKSNVLSDSMLRFGSFDQSKVTATFYNSWKRKVVREAFQTPRQTDTTPRKAGHPSHISIATTKKVPLAFGDQLLTGRDGTLLCSAGTEWYGYLGIIDTEASTWAPAVGRPSKSVGCLAAQKKKKKKRATWTRRKLQQSPLGRALVHLVHDVTWSVLW